jgi:hypothetical protein
MTQADIYLFDASNCIVSYNYTTLCSARYNNLLEIKLYVIIK